MRARIYKPSKTAMSSGLAKTKSWVLEFIQETTSEIDPLMGCLLYTSDAADDQ